MKIALISGITGQDGSYLAELLLSKNYIVHGIVRRASSFNTFRIDHLYNNKLLLNKTFFMHYGDLTDSSNLNRLLEKIKPDEIYNLAAQSHVKVSFDVPEYTAEVDGIGTLRFLDAIKDTGTNAKFYQASTSEQYGNANEVSQNEETPFHPRSPYAAAKLFSYWIVRNYREAYNIFCTNGILFNHESERRGRTFVTRKISVGVSKIILGQEKNLVLGNLEAKRDWGYAPEYVEGIWRMLQHDIPDDFVLATNESHSIKEFVDASFLYFGINLDWDLNDKGYKGIVNKLNLNDLDYLKDSDKYLIEKFFNKMNRKVVIKTNKIHERPSEVNTLLGDYSKAKDKLGWEPKVRFNELVRIMLKADFIKRKQKTK